MSAMQNVSSLLEIQVFSKLTPKLLAQTKKFVHLCKQFDGYEAPFHWDCIEKRKNPFTHEILCYINQTLVGYVALYYFRDKEVEITMLVHPDYRQLKILRLIWEQIKLTVHRNKVETDYYTFTLHEKDKCLIDLLRDAEANRSHAIYKLSLSDKTFYNIKPLEIPAHISIRESTPSDMDTLVELECQCFNTSQTAYSENLKNLSLDPKQKSYVLLNNEIIIGKIHFTLHKTTAFIYDFCVLPHEQHKGYGSLLLQQALTSLLKAPIKKVFLETATQEHLKWYKKMGFKEHAVFEHWKLYYPNFVKYHDQQYRMLVLNHYQEYDLLA